MNELVVVARQRLGTEPSGRQSTPILNANVAQAS